MRNAGLSTAQAKADANAAIENFAHWCNRVDVPQETHDTLVKLAGKWPLMAITSGNTRPELFGSNDYFRFVLRTGPDGRPKLFTDMYHLAAVHLSLPFGHILHVSDDPTTDVTDSLRCRMQACQVKSQGTGLMHTAGSHLLPHTEASRLASLTLLVWSSATLYTLTGAHGTPSLPVVPMGTSYLLDNLNDKQHKTIATSYTSVLVLTGAGSGKTCVPAHRITWLLSVENYSPYSTMAVTFTNEAAMEIHHCVGRLMGTTQDDMWAGTFYGLTHRLLRVHHPDTSLPQDFQVLGNENQPRLLRRLIRMMNLDEKQ